MARAKKRSRNLRNPPAEIVSVNGRPTSYDPSYCQKLIEHMSQGRSYETFARHVNVAVSTLYCWEAQHAAFSEAKRIGVQARTELYEDIARNIAMGLVPNPPLDEQGRPIGMMTRGNAGMAMFMLRNIAPDRYKPMAGDPSLPPAGANPSAPSEAIVNFNYKRIEAAPIVEAPATPTPSGESE